MPVVRCLQGKHNIWTRTLDRYTKASVPEFVVSTMSGPPPETSQDRTQRTHTNPRIGIKISDPVGLEGRDSTDHATATDKAPSCKH